MKISHSDLVELLMDRMIEQMTLEDYEQYFYETQMDYFDEVGL